MIGGTWICHACGDERPDWLISVAVHSFELAPGAPMGIQIRYCNDRPTCRAAAHACRGCGNHRPDPTAVENPLLARARIVAAGGAV